MSAQAVSVTSDATIHPFVTRQSFSNDELLALLGAARRARERNWLMILVAYWHGLRASEVTAIQQHDVADGYLTVRRLKGSLKTIQPLIEHKVALLNERGALERFVASMRPNQKVFPIGRVWFWRLVQRYARGPYPTTEGPPARPQALYRDPHHWFSGHRECAAVARAQVDRFDWRVSSRHGRSGCGRDPHRGAVHLIFQRFFQMAGAKGRSGGPRPGAGRKASRPEMPESGIKQAFAGRAPTSGKQRSFGPGVLRILADARNANR
jgi:hypothetical protein